MGPALRVGRHTSIGMWGTGDRSRLFVTSHADDETYMIDAERLELLQRWPVGDVAGTVSSDGSTFALGSQEGEVRLLDLRSGRVRRLAGRSRRLRREDGFHARRADARDLRSRRDADRLGRQRPGGPRDALRSRQRLDLGTGRLGRRAHRLQRRRRWTLVRLGSRRRPPPRPAVRRRPAVRPRRRRHPAARARAQPGRPHARPGQQRWHGRPDRRRDAAAAGEPAGAARLRRRHWRSARTVACWRPRASTAR